MITRSAREFITEITDIDNRLFKTFIGLFRNPQRVVEAGVEGLSTYTKPIRYILLTSTVFIIWRLLYDDYVERLFTNDIPDIEDWFLPARIAKATSQFNHLADTLFPFQILLFVVPVAIVALKLFSLGEKWRRARHIALYSFGHLWVVLTLLIPALVTFGTYKLLVILIAFAVTGFIFGKLLAKSIWIGFIKWMGVGILLTIWFFEFSLPATQWCLIQFVLPDRHEVTNESTKPLEEIQLPVEEASAASVAPVIRDPEHRILTVLEKPEGLRIQCYQSDTSLLWQTLLPEMKTIRKTFSVQLPSFERGLLVLAQNSPTLSNAILISAKGKILFTKVYQEEMVLNGGDLVNETLVLAGGKSNGEGTTPFIDVLQLRFQPQGVFELTKERTHFMHGVGNRFDDIYVIHSSPGNINLIVSKYETTKAKTSNVGAMDLNRVSIIRMMVDSTLHTVWETEIFKRASKYSPIKSEAFGMRYDPVYQRIIAFYSVANDQDAAAHLLNIDTLGRIAFEKKIKVNELTFITDLHSAQEGIYFCGWTCLGINSPLLDFGSQGLIGFVSKDGITSRLNTVGQDRQGDNLVFYKIVATDSPRIWGYYVRDAFAMTKAEWKVLKLDRL